LRLRQKRCDDSRSRSPFSRSGSGSQPDTTMAVDGEDRAAELGRAWLQRWQDAGFTSSSTLSLARTGASHASQPQAFAGATTSSAVPCGHLPRFASTPSSSAYGGLGLAGVANQLQGLSLNAPMGTLHPFHLPARAGSVIQSGLPVGAVSYPTSSRLRAEAPIFTPAGGFKAEQRPSAAGDRLAGA